MHGEIPDKRSRAKNGIPIKIKPIKARTLMLENQNSSSPNTRTPRRLMKKTGGEEVSYRSGIRGEVERTEGDEDDHPYANVDFATTIPVLEDSTSGVDVVGGDDEVLHEVVVS